MTQLMKRLKAMLENRFIATFNTGLADFDFRVLNQSLAARCLPRINRTDGSACFMELYAAWHSA